MEQKITQEVALAKFNQELTQLKFQEALNRLSAMEVRSDTLSENQQVLKNARAFVKKFDEIKTKLKASALAECRFYDAAYKSLSEPFLMVIEEKNNTIQIVANKVAEENRKKEQELLRVNNIKSYIDSFVLEQTKSIASSLTTEEIVKIEKLIGSHKANESRYQEFLPELITRISELSHLIKKQKGLIKELEKAEKEQAAAKASGDDEKFLDLEAKKEILQYGLEETKVVLQETAISSAINNNAPILAEEVLPTVKARRNSFSFRVIDEKKAFASGMLICELDKEKAKLVLSGIKEEVKPGEPKIINGIEYFVEVTY